MVDQWQTALRASWPRVLQPSAIGNPLVERDFIFWHSSLYHQCCFQTLPRADAALKLKMDDEKVEPLYLASASTCSKESCR